MLFTADEIKKLWEDNEPWQRACAIFWEKLIAIILKVIELTFIKRTTWILPQIVHDAPITGAHTILY